MTKIAHIFTACVLAGAALFAAAPHAAAETEAQTQISLRGYDLSNDQDRERLAVQISRAARTVCGVSGQRMTLGERNDAHRCMADARAKAMAELEQRRPQRVAGLD